MVLHVTGSLDAARILRSLKLAEDLSVRFTRDICQHVETATVCHRNGNFIESRFGCRLENLVHEADRRFGALHAESFLPHVLGLKEGFESFCLVELRQDA